MPNRSSKPPRLQKPEKWLGYIMAVGTFLLVQSEVQDRVLGFLVYCGGSEEWWRNVLRPYPPIWFFVGGLALVLHARLRAISSQLEPASENSADAEKKQKLVDQMTAVTRDLRDFAGAYYALQNELSAYLEAGADIEDPQDFRSKLDNAAGQYLAAILGGSFAQRLRAWGQGSEYIQGDWRKLDHQLHDQGQFLERTVLKEIKPEQVTNFGQRAKLRPAVALPDVPMLQFLRGTKP